MSVWEGIFRCLHHLHRTNTSTVLLACKHHHPTTYDDWLVLSTIEQPSALGRSNNNTHCTRIKHHPSCRPLRSVHRVSQANSHCEKPSAWGTHRHQPQDPTTGTTVQTPAPLPAPKRAAEPTPPITNGLDNFKTTPLLAHRK